MKTMTARYHRTRPDLPQGREWLVNGKYIVTVYADAEFGRVATCRCKAFTFGLACKHIGYVQRVDSILTRAPVREIQPVAA